MSSLSNSLQLKHGLALWCPHSSSLTRPHPSSSIRFRSFHRNFVVASSSFSNDNRESVYLNQIFLLFYFPIWSIILCLYNLIEFGLFIRFVIVGGGNAAGYAARTFVEHGMADGRLCIVSKEVNSISYFAFWVLNFRTWREDDDW